MSEARSYPRRAKTEAGEIEFRLMSRADEAAVLAFARALPTHDLLFLPRNISQPKVLSAWVKEIERGDIVSLLAVKSGRVVGCGTLVRAECIPLRRAVGREDVREGPTPDSPRGANEAAARLLHGADAAWGAQER